MCSDTVGVLGGGALHFATQLCVRLMYTCTSPTPELVMVSFHRPSHSS